MFYKNQWITALNVAFLAGITAAALTWPSSVVELFQSPETPLTRPATAVEASLLGSLSSIGGVLGTPLCAYLFDRVGRKRTSILCGVPFVVLWATLVISDRIELVLAALFVSGLAGSGLMMCLVYVTEIASSEVRGGLGTVPVVGYSLGMLASYALGGYVPYRVVVLVQLAQSVLYLATIQFACESPVYLLQRHDEEGALAALACYRELPTDSKQLLDEFYEMKRSLRSAMEAEAPDTTALSPEHEKLQTAAALEAEAAPEQSASLLSTARCLLRSRASKRALVLCLVLVTASIFMGMIPVMVYASTLFRRATPDLPAPVCSMLLAVSMLLAGLISAAVSDRLGRKTLMVAASGASGAFTLLMATQLHVGWAPDWFGIVLILAFTFVYSFGPSIVPFIMIGEVFAPEVRALASMLVLEWVGIINFALLFAFGPLVEAITLHGVFYAFSAVCWAAVVYCVAAMPETKGLENHEIVQRFDKPRGRAQATSPRVAAAAAATPHAAAAPHATPHNTKATSREP